MAIAVVIVNYNSGALLERCLACLQDQTLKPDHIIVVDNNSTEALSGKLLDSLTGITVIRLPENVGYGAAINAAAEELKDVDLLCCLNPDAFPDADWLEQLQLVSFSHPDCGAFASLMIDAADPALIDGAGDVLHLSGIPWRRYHGRQSTSVALEAGPVFSACGGAAMYRMAAFQAVGGFDEHYFMYLEDVDLGMRLQLAGYSCWFEPSARVQHIGSAITGYQSDFSVYHGHRNVIYNYFKNMPVFLLIVLLPLHVAMNIMVMVVYSFRGKFASILNAKLDGLRMIPLAIQQRSKHQGQQTDIRRFWSGLTITGDR